MPSAAEVRATHPLTLRHLGEPFLAEYLAKGAGLPFADYVNARFASGTIPDRAARDLARYESEMARLRPLPALRGTSAPLPPDDVPLRISPEIAFITYGADLPGVLEALRKGEPAQPRPRRNWLLLLPRGSGEVEVRHLEREEGWVLEWFRTPTPLADVLDLLEERDGAEQAWREGLLVAA